jgi:hypothetical protein
MLGAGLFRLGWAAEPGVLRHAKTEPGVYVVRLALYAVL